jgi:hypothetical protein
VQPPSWSNEVVVDAVAVLEAPLEVEALLDRHPPSGVVSYISAQPWKADFPKGNLPFQTQKADILNRRGHGFGKLSEKVFSCRLC